MILGWTQDDGMVNIGPGHLVQTEDDMIKSLKRFAHALSPEQFSTLFSLYQPSDFEEELNNYKSHKSAEDPEISINYF